MTRNKKNKREKTTKKTYKIKMPVYTTSIIEEEVGMFELNYKVMVENLKTSIRNFCFPIKHDNTNKTMVTVIDNISSIDVKIGDREALLLKMSSYKTNLIDGYFEGNEKINFLPSSKIGSDENYILFYPIIKGLQPSNYQCYFLMVVYEDPTKESGEVSRLAKIVANNVIKQPIQNIKIPMIMEELRRIGNIPELNIKFYSVENGDDTIDAQYKEYLQTACLKKNKSQSFLNMPFDTMQSLLHDTDENEVYQKKEVFFLIGKKEYKIKKEIINEANNIIKETAEKIFNATTDVSQDELDNKIHDTNFITEKMSIVINHYLSTEC